jgi:methyl-accepting chemotaxis protein
MIINVAYPIILKDGSFVGAVVLSLVSDRFDSIINDINIFGTGYGVLLSHNGTIISSPYADTVNSNIGNITYMKGYHPSDIIKNISNDEMTAYKWNHSIRKEDMYSVLVPIHVSGLQSMAVNLTFAMNAAYEAVGLPQMLLISRIISICAIIIIIITTIYIRKGIIRYLTQFTNALKDLTGGEGDLTKVINIKTGDEFETLAGYLNTFMSNLKGIISDVKLAANDVAAGNSELAATMEELSTTFASQAEQVSMVAKGMDTISDSSKMMVETLPII